MILTCIWRLIMILQFKLHTWELCRYNSPGDICNQGEKQFYWNSLKRDFISAKKVGLIRAFSFSFLILFFCFVFWSLNFLNGLFCVTVRFLIFLSSFCCLLFLGRQVMNLRKSFLQINNTKHNLFLLKVSHFQNLDHLFIFWIYD